MDPYAAQTFPQNLPPNQDPYLYNLRYNQPQYSYNPQIPQHQYHNPIPNHEHALFHPPVVPIQNHPNQIAAYQHVYHQTNLQNVPTSYYPHQQPHQVSSDPAMGPQQQWQQQGQLGDYGLISLYPQNGQGQCSGSGRSGGRASRGGDSSFCRRGRSRGGGGKTSIGQPKPQCMARCELCRVDCNTLKILEDHKKGKKHINNIKTQENLQKLAAKTQETKPVTEKPENPTLVDGSKVKSQVKVSEAQGKSLKRKNIRDGERKSEKASKKPMKIIPFNCELCKVNCESVTNFDSHLKGKNHALNLQRFQEQQAVLGVAALQALYPALEALYPALLQAISQNANAFTSTVNVGLDHQLLQQLRPYLPQAGPQGPISEPAVVAQGPNVDATDEPKNQVAPVDDIKELESKHEDKVEPETKTEEHAAPGSSVNDNGSCGWIDE